MALDRTAFYIDSRKLHLLLRNLSVVSFRSTTLDMTILLSYDEFTLCHFERHVVRDLEFSFGIHHQQNMLWWERVEQFMFSTFGGI